MKNVKKCKKSTKNTISSYPLRESTNFCMPTSFEEKTKTHFFWFIFRHFLLISGVKSLKKIKNLEKGLETAEKRVSTSFQVRAARESWSKYTACLLLDFSEIFWNLGKLQMRQLTTGTKNVQLSKVNDLEVQFLLLYICGLIPPQILARIQVLQILTSLYVFVETIWSSLR